MPEMTNTANEGNTADDLDTSTMISQGCSRIMTTEYLLLAGILFVIVVIKILFAVVDPVIKVDGVVYIAAAKQIAAKDFRAALEIYSMPFYPLLIALMHDLVKNLLCSLSDSQNI